MGRLDEKIAADVLSDVLRSLRANGTVYFCDQLTAPWTKRFLELDAASFHQVRRGRCRITVEDKQLVLEPGDLVFVGPGIEHVLNRDKLETEAKDDLDASTLLLCGYCQFELAGTGPSASLFPKFAVLRREQLMERAWLAGVLDQLSAEYMSFAPGSTLVVNRLTEVLVVELIRMNFGQDGQGELLKALADPAIATALQALHEHPEKGWTLESMAKHAGLSRAGLAARFRDLVGQPMFAYLTSLRVERACVLLSESELALSEVALRVGYESDVAFVKMFKKQTGQTPTAWRKAKRLG